MEWLQACHLLTVGLLVFITADKNLEIGGGYDPVMSYISNSSFHS